MTRPARKPPPGDDVRRDAMVPPWRLLLPPAPRRMLSLSVQVEVTRKGSRACKRGAVGPSLSAPHASSHITSTPTSRAGRC
eukprot:874919-Rhodomonas_salina.1